ncbi:Jacalin-related lectin 14 [Raphanus sativus]|uniref:Jacalin-related lectin 14-like n=1 Tax=Raphanus sativus TaxID=3726 RepID=A0A9W3CE89_RAPSA|nr:jacalin-related lectin 14-like [Raphanus sativus]KAJ4878504.1 Jacalin-related lectin 14 [Raphanus sativus]
MAQKLEAIGSTNGFTFDDGSDHDGVSKIYVGGGLQGILYMEFEYVKSEQLKFGSLVGRRHRGFIETFEINHVKNEHLESVEGYYDHESGYIQGLQFKTNFRVSELIGYEKGNKFTLEVKGRKISGFHGYMRKRNIVSLGAYFTTILPSRLDVKGGKGGHQWDDGANHDGVTKIHVRGGFEGIQYIKFDYVLKNGETQDGPIHGISGSGFTQTFEINHFNDEHLAYVEGYYDDASGVIQALQFTTNLKTSDVLGYEKGKKFLLAEKGKKIIGFHGYADKNLNSLGAYFTTVSLTKSERHGGSEGIYWDDGVFESIRTVYVSYDTANVKSITFHYHNRTVIERQHGWQTIQDDLEEEEFELDYPNEVITYVEGTFKRFGPGKTRVTSLIFKSSEGRTSSTFGVVYGTKFVLEKKGCAVVGFHGRHDDRDLVSIGAYFSPMPPPTAEKLRAQGGLRGESWDDGVFDGVRKLYVGQGDNGVAFLKVVYGRDTRIIIGEDHGNTTPLDVKEFELEYPSEYVTAVDGCYDKVIGSEVEVITMLRFTTNKRTSTPVGFVSTSSFLLYKDGFKIVGFHGKSSNMINQLGVHVLPFTY